MAKPDQSLDEPRVYLLKLDQMIAGLREEGLTKWADELIEIRRQLPVAIANARMIVKHRQELIAQAEMIKKDADRYASDKLRELEDNVASFMMHDTMVIAAEKMSNKIIKDAEEKAERIIQEAGSAGGSGV